MQELLTNILELTSQMGVYIYSLVFIAAFSETVLGVGLLIPGSTIILIFGALASSNIISIWATIVMSILGAVLGDNINYYLGKKYGKSWISEDSWILTPANYKTGKIFFDEHGVKSILFGRFVPAIKEIIPFIAGLMHMDRREFYLYNVLGAIGWSLEWVGLGYFFGYSFNLAETWIHRIKIIFLFLLFGVLLYYITIKVLFDKHKK